MPVIPINYLAVIAAAVAAMVVGFLWYGPLFGKIFMHAMGMDSWSKEKQTEMKKKMIPLYILQLVASLVMFYVFCWYFSATGQIGITGGLTNAFLIWIGFVVPLKLGDAIWAGNKTLFWLGIGNMLVTLLVAGVIIGAWS